MAALPDPPLVTNFTGIEAEIKLSVVPFSGVEKDTVWVTVIET